MIQQTHCVYIEDLISHQTYYKQAQRTLCIRCDMLNFLVFVTLGDHVKLESQRLVSCRMYLYYLVFLLENGHVPCFVSLQVH